MNIKPDRHHAGRYHGLNVLRSFAMLMGIVFCAPQFYYIPEVADWFRDFGISTNMIPQMDFWLQILVQWSHSWQMTALFTISGFFALMVFRRKGAAHLVRDSILRLGLTLILVASIYDMLDGTLSHTWFIYYLLIFSLMASFCWKLTSSPSTIDQTSGSSRFADQSSDCFRSREDVL